MNRWAKNGVLARVFVHLQREQIVRVKLDPVPMDGAIVKVHPDLPGSIMDHPPPSGPNYSPHLLDVTALYAIYEAVD